MVTKMSAERIGQSVRNIRHLLSDSNHRHLIRFEESTDAKYISLRNNLRLMATHAPQELQSRARSGYFGGAMQVGECLNTSVLSLHGIIQCISAAA